MKRSVIPPIAVLLVLGASANTGRSAAPKAKTDSARLPGVPALVEAQFERVPGGAAKQSVLDAGPSGRWNSAYATSPTVDFDGKTYRMWFVGGTPTQDPDVPYGHLNRIGLAESADGRLWTLANDGEPVLDLGPPGSPDAKGLAHPYVLRVGKRYLMWYAAIDGSQARDLGLTPAHVRIERICLATSDDGIHWTRANSGRPILDIGDKGTVDSIQTGAMHVLRVGERFMMWYSAYNGRHTLAVATSPDGIRWTRANDGKPIEGLIGGGQGQTGPSVYHDGLRFFLLYCGDKGGEWKMYAAVSDDGFHFKHVNDGRPVLGPPPPGSFGTAGVGRNHSVHPSQMLVDAGRVRVWFNAEDGSPPHLQRIGLMEAALTSAKAAKTARDGDRKLTSAERITVARSAAWGVINTLADGSLGLTLQRARPLEAISAANVCMEWLRSTDSGRSWSKPVLIAERRGCECSRILRGLGSR